MTTQLLKTREAAQMLNITVATLRKLVEEKKIGYIDIGTGKYRLFRFKQEHIEEYLSRNEIKAS